MSGGYTAIKEGVYTLEIKRSEFLAYSFPVRDENDAAEKLAAVRKKHYDARHVCYAYIADEQGLIARFSDDGEPSGTAGKPILDVIKKNGLSKSLIAVVRYFGGILLGAGGLTRAYSDSAAGAVKTNGTITYVQKNVLKAQTDYSTYKKISSAVKSLGEIIGVEYSDGVTFRLACNDGDKTGRMLTESANGKISVAREKDEYFATEEK